MMQLNQHKAIGNLTRATTMKLNIEIDALMLAAPRDQPRVKCVSAWLRACALAIMLFILTISHGAHAASTEEVVALLLPLNLIAAHTKTSVGNAMEFIRMLGLEIMPKGAARNGRFSDETARFEISLMWPPPQALMLWRLGQEPLALAVVVGSYAAARAEQFYL